MNTHMPDDLSHESPKMQRGTRRIVLPVAIFCFVIGFVALVIGGVIGYRGHEQGAQSAQSIPPAASPAAPTTTGQGSATGSAADESRKDISTGAR